MHLRSLSAAGLVLVALVPVGARAVALHPVAPAAWHAAALDRAVLEASPRLAARADSIGVVRLDAAAMDAVLARAPHEAGAAAGASAPLIGLPSPDGSFAVYRVVESPIMDADLSARFPEIRTFAVVSEDGTAAGRMTRTPRGISALVIDDGIPLRIEPLAGGADGRHLSYVESDLLDDSGLACGADGTIGLPPLVADPASPHLASGSTLRTYRLAVATTGEYYAARGGTDAAVLASIVTDMNLVNTRYGIELAIAFVIVNSTTDVFYTNAGTDPYTDGTPCTMRGEAQADILAVVGAGNFDIGHVFGAVPAGGCAGGANACSAAKANGASTFQTDALHPAGHEDYGGYRLVMHEMGHQFGAGHTWNASNTGNCTPAQYAPASAAEPSSGTTIMSYSGTCAPDNIRSGVADAYFHVISYDEIVTFSASGAGDGCAQPSASGNTPPTVDAGADFTIPRGTPFTLTGSGSDADGHALTFTWEQADLGLGQLGPNLDDGGSPLFRSFPPGPGGNVRTFPQMPVVLGDMPPQVGETLPTTDRTMTFRLVARDDRPVGGVEYDTAVVTTSGSFFAVTLPGSFDVQRAGCTASVDWAVGSAATHAAEARILWSTDGGNTFDVELAVVPIDEPPVQVQLPCGATTEGRIKVESVGNVFFDVNPGDFEVVAEPPTIDLAAPAAFVEEDCAGSVSFQATVVDDCGLSPGDVGVTASLESGTATVGPPDFDVMILDAASLLVTGTVPVSDLAGCPARVRIEVAAADACGVEALQVAVADVLDEVAPVLVGVPSDATVECDEVPGPPAVVATDNCGGPPAVGFGEAMTPGDCPGNYQLLRTWTAVDLCGNETTGQQLVAVEDTQPPAIVEALADVACLWPPNHAMRCFDAAEFTPSISDACSDPVAWRFVGCPPDQPEGGNGDGHAEPDCVVSDDGQGFCVRAERSGGDPAGRRYAVMIEAEDACGNVSAPAVVGHVHVPHAKKGCSVAP